MNFVYQEQEEEVDIKMKQSLGVVEPGAEELFEWCLKVPQLPPSMHDPNTMSIRYQLNFMVRIRTCLTAFESIMKQMQLNYKPIP